MNMLNTKDASSEQKRIEEDLMLNGLRLEAFIRLFEQKQKTSNLSDKEKLLLEDLKQEQFKIGFFYTTRLLTNLGKYIDGIDETAVIKILEASGIEINEPQVKEAVEQYHKRQKQLAKKPQPAQTSYKTSEGMLLTLKENGEGRTIHLEEDLETNRTTRLRYRRTVLLCGLILTFGYFFLLVG